MIFCCRFETGSIVQPPFQLTQQYWLPPFLLLTLFLSLWKIAALPMLANRRFGMESILNDSKTAWYSLLILVLLKPTLHPPSPSSLHVGIKVKPRQFNSSHSDYYCSRCFTARYVERSSRFPLCLRKFCPLVVIHEIFPLDSFTKIWFFPSIVFREKRDFLPGFFPYINLYSELIPPSCILPRSSATRNATVTLFRKNQCITRKTVTVLCPLVLANILRESKTKKLLFVYLKYCIKIYDL